MFEKLRRRLREDLNYDRRIADITGIQPRQVRDREIYSFYNTYINDRENPADPLFKKYLGNTENVDDFRVFQERGQQFAQLVEARLDLKPQSYSYGLFYPNYLRALNQYPDAKTKSDHTSLLVGALTPDTVQEYASCVKSVFSKAKCLITDIEGVTTTKNSETQFVFGDAQKLPFRSGSIDTLHTNILLLHMEDPTSQNCGNEQSFFDEAQRVLKPGGQLLLVEGKRSLEDKQLTDAGFTIKQRGPAVQMESRRDMERFTETLQGGKEERPYLKIAPLVEFTVAEKRYH